MKERFGFLLILLTAVISGFSIFLNKFAVAGFNPFAFTFLKNAAVACFLFSVILVLKESSSLKQLSRKQWLQLSAIGVLGGSVPFLLFFHALSLTSALNAGFIHKTLFIWASVFAFLFLKEKISKQFIAAAFLLFAGNMLLFGLTSFGLPEALILAASVFWAAENVAAKRILRDLSGTTVAFGRMFFGSIFILLFLAATNQLYFTFSLSIPQIQWLLLSSALLFGYVLTYYSGLKHVPVHKAAALLLLAQPITAVLSQAFFPAAFSFEEALGITLIVAGSLLAFGFSYFVSFSKRKAFSGVQGK